MAGEALALLIERARDFDDDQCEQFTLITLVIANMVKAASERATALGTLSVQQYCDHMKRMVNVIAEKSRNIQ